MSHWIRRHYQLKNLRRKSIDAEGGRHLRWRLRLGIFQSLVPRSTVPPSRQVRKLREGPRNEGLRMKSKIQWMSCLSLRWLTGGEGRAEQENRELENLIDIREFEILK